MPSFSQESRVGRLLTPLADNTLVLLEFSGTEFINDISTFRVRAVAEDNPVDLDALLGKPMTVDFQTQHGQRYFNLTVFSARCLGRDGNYLFYDFELRPWIWAMARRETSRIFTEMSVKEIISQVLDEYASLDNSYYEFNLRNSPQILEYTVQYRESDLNFVRRLLEEYGINFHIRMDGSQQALVMSDSTDGFDTVPGPARIYLPEQGSHDWVVERFHTWLAQRMVTTGAVKLMDYDFKRPAIALDVLKEDEKDYANASFESYDYPGRYVEQTEGRKLAQRRLDAFRMADATVRADGNLLSLGAGMAFTLAKHPIDEENGKYVCLSAHHHYSDGGYRSGGRHSVTYDGYFSLTKEANPIAPERLTPRGQVRGPHTAVVVDGMDGEVDVWGRITVRFHWDANAKSMPCRVSQMWSGPQWGSIFVPRAGMEVIVEFLEGDPDRPMIMGCVYNGENMPPYPLPDKKQISGFKTQTMGGGAGYNELIFDDTGGDELIRIHGQRDLDVTIENDERHEIRMHSTRKILGNRTDTIKGNQTSTVEQKQDTTVTGARTVTVKSTETKTVTDKLTISSDTKIEIKVGTSSITIDPTGIKITAIKVEILASAQLETNGSAMAKHTSGGVVQIQGPLVTIN